MPDALRDQSRAALLDEMRRWILSETDVDDSEAEAEAFAKFLAAGCLDMAVDHIREALHELDGTYEDVGGTARNFLSAFLETP